MSERLERVSGGGPVPGTDPLGRWVGGRARRREYWLWLIPALVASELISLTEMPLLRLLVAPFLLLAMIRRLHDLGRTGWFAPAINIGSNVLGVALTAILGAETGGPIAYLLHLAVLILLGALPGQARTNGFGPPPGRKTADLAETFS